MRPNTKVSCQHLFAHLHNFDALTITLSSTSISALAMQTGLRFRKIDEQVAQKAFKVVSGTNVESYYAHVEFEMYKRLLDKEAPDYKD